MFSRTYLTEDKKPNLGFMLLTIFGNNAKYDDLMLCIKFECKCFFSVTPFRPNDCFKTTPTIRSSSLTRVTRPSSFTWEEDKVDFFFWCLSVLISRPPKTAFLHPIQYIIAEGGATYNDKWKVLLWDKLEKGLTNRCVPVNQRSGYGP